VKGNRTLIPGGDAVQKFAYLTHDEVNEAFVFGRAEQAGVSLEPLSLRDPPPDGQFKRALIDWDSLDVAGREDLLAALLARPASGRLGVHYYGLDEDDVVRLRRQGVHAFERLVPHVLDWLIEGDEEPSSGVEPAGDPEAARHPGHAVAPAATCAVN
jgi:hypothetical protein